MNQGTMSSSVVAHIRDELNKLALIQVRDLMCSTCPSSPRHRANVCPRKNGDKKEVVILGPNVGGSLLQSFHLHQVRSQTASLDPCCKTKASPKRVISNRTQNFQLTLAQLWAQSPDEPSSPAVRGFRLLMPEESLENKLGGSKWPHWGALLFSVEHLF